MATRIAIEWARNSLRLAVSKGSQDRWRLRELRVEPFESGTAPAAVLRTALKALRLGGGVRVIGVIPREQVILRVMKFPTTSSEELRQMVELSGKAQLPYATEQAIVDYSLIDQREGFSTVAMVACQRDFLERQLHPLHEAGLQVECLTVSSSGVLGWYTAARMTSLVEPVLVINRDEDRTDLVLIRDGRLLLTRSIPSGSDEDGPELLTHEIEQSLSTLRKDLPGIEVRSLLLTGVGPLAAWKEKASQHLSLPASVVDGAQPLTGRAMSETASASPVVVGGAACAPTRQLLNLNPPEVRQTTRHQSQVREVVTVGALLLAVLVLGGSVSALHVYRQYRLIARIDQAISEVDPLTRQTKTAAQRVELVTAVLEQRRRLAALLGGVFRSTPSTITLDALTFDRLRREMGLRGRAPSTQDVLAYRKALEQLEGVVEARLKYATARQTADGERADFEILVKTTDHEPRPATR